MIEIFGVGNDAIVFLRPKLVNVFVPFGSLLLVFVEHSAELAPGVVVGDVEDRVVVPPPRVKVVVEMVVSVEQLEEGGEAMRRRKVEDVDEGVGRGVVGVVAAAQHDGHRRRGGQHAPKLFGDVIAANRVFEGEIKLVVIGEHAEAFLLLGPRAVEFPTGAVNVDVDVFAELLDEILASARRVAVGDEPGDEARLGRSHVGWRRRRRCVGGAGFIVDAAAKPRRDPTGAPV